MLFLLVIPRDGLSSLPYFLQFIKFSDGDVCFCSSSYSSGESFNAFSVLGSELLLIIFSFCSSRSFQSGTSFKLLDKPKSQICIVQSSFTNMFSGFRSLWQILALCKQLIPQRMSYMILLHWTSSRNLLDRSSFFMSMSHLSSTKQASFMVSISLGGKTVTSLFKHG